jgi:hypothetical protein
MNLHRCNNRGRYSYKNGNHNNGSPDVFATRLCFCILFVLEFARVVMSAVYLKHCYRVERRELVRRYGSGSRGKVETRLKRNTRQRREIFTLWALFLPSCSWAGDAGAQAVFFVSGLHVVGTTGRDPESHVGDTTI